MISNLGIKSIYRFLSKGGSIKITDGKHIDQLVMIYTNNGEHIGSWPKYTNFGKFIIRNYNYGQEINKKRA